MHARHFWEIPAALVADSALRARFLQLAASDTIPGKVLEGGRRLADFRAGLAAFGNGAITLDGLVARCERDLPRSASPHAANNRVFPDGWAERIVRTQVSRFYNQGVLELVLEGGGTRVAVEHSPDEAGDSRCTTELAGREHDAKALLVLLLSAYRDGDYKRDRATVPDHPHCTHTARPVGG